MANQICTLCGYAGEMNKKARGSGLVEFLLWCFFLVPGVVYSIWSRGGNGKNVCPKCESTTIIPLNTPMGQKLMAEQKNNPSIQVQAQTEKSSNRARNFAIFGAISFVVLIVVSINSTENVTNKVESQQASQPAQQAVSQNKPTAQNLPTEPKTRIEAIVKNLGANYEVTIFGKNPNAKPVAPYEVIINADAGSCASAKQINFDVMKALYTDTIASKDIARIRFNARKYLSTSLGGDDARESTSKTWAESGPTNFLIVLTQMGSGDISYRDMEKQTWGNPTDGCK